MLVKLDHFLRDRAEHKKDLEPPARQWLIYLEYKLRMGRWMVPLGWYPGTLNNNQPHIIVDFQHKFPKTITNNQQIISIK